MNDTDRQRTTLTLEEQADYLGQLASFEQAPAPKLAMEMGAEALKLLAGLQAKQWRDLIATVLGRAGWRGGE